MGTVDRPAETVTRCDWTENSEGYWDTGCGNCFCIEADSPFENGMNFCCFCGQPLSEQKYSELGDDDE